MDHDVSTVSIQVEIGPKDKQLFLQTWGSTKPASLPDSYDAEGKQRLCYQVNVPQEKSEEFRTFIRRRLGGFCKIAAK